jgi:hypothetical protein
MSHKTSKIKLLTDMKKIVISILPVLMVACVSQNREIEIGLKERIHHDDFEYSVQNYLVSRFLKNGNDTLKAKGVFYMITFRTENLAMRVNHKWDNSIAFIVDEKDRIYENEPKVQEFYENARPFGLKEKYVTPAGGSGSTILAFDIPFDATRPWLKVRGKILMGDVLNGARFKRMRIRLF